MPKDECRESRAVPFSDEGAAWAAAAEGAVRETIGADVDAMGRLLPSPSKTQLPYQRQLPPFGKMHSPAHVSGTGAVWGSVVSVRGALSVAPPLRPARTPLGVRNGNVDVTQETLAAEVRALELKLQQKDRQIKAQENLISGFCKLQIAQGPSK